MPRTEFAGEPPKRPLAGIGAGGPCSRAEDGHDTHVLGTVDGSSLPMAGACAIFPPIKQRTQTVALPATLWTPKTSDLKARARGGVGKAGRIKSFCCCPTRPIKKCLCEAHDSLERGSWRLVSPPWIMILKTRSLVRLSPGREVDGGVCRLG